MHVRAGRARLLMNRLHARIASLATIMHVIAEFLATNGLAEPDNDKLAAIPWLKVWGTWDTMLQEPWDKVAAYANPRQSVSSNLIKLSTYHSWFMTGDIPQEELEAGLQRTQSFQAQKVLNMKKVPQYLSISFSRVRQTQGKEQHSPLCGA